MSVQAQTMTVQENLGYTVVGGKILQDLFMEDAGGFNNTVDLQQQKPSLMTNQCDQFHNSSPYKSQNIMFGNSVGTDHGLQSLPSLVSAHIDKQRLDLDQLLSLQAERLRLALQLQRKQQISILLNRYESKARALIGKKDEEISKASKKTAQLQEYVGRMEIENLKWQRIAKEKEATVESLNNAIEKMRENACVSENVAGDAESCCLVVEDEDRRLDNDINVDQRIDNSKNMFCRCCKNKSSCVIFLPCRHLCSCKDCEAWLDSCPVCNVVKRATIDALF